MVWAYILLLVVVAVSVVKLGATAVCNLYFHPLSRYPGPRLWIAFPLLRYIAACRGRFDRYMVVAHAKYGPIVRFSNDSLSFISAQAWKDIYGYGHGQNQWPKSTFSPPDGIQNIFSATDENHARFRKALSHAFSEQALRKQEPLVQKYVDVLVRRLDEAARAGENVDMTEWYKLAFFDIISDLSFGQPSTCLQDGRVPAYQEVFANFARSIPFLHLAQVYPLIWQILILTVGKRMKATQEQFAQAGRDIVNQRRADKTKDGRGDFMEALLNYHESKDPFTDQELATTSQILFFAGAETSSTTMTGLMWYLLQNNDALTRVTAEVRSAFQNEDEITFVSATSKLPYMLASFEEGMRIYPPVPTIHLREMTETASVSEHILPAGTLVGVHQLAAGHAESNFTNATSFHPERWLQEGRLADSPFHTDQREARQPFGVGPRNCIGKNLATAEMRLVLARLLWRFDFELVDESARWADQPIAGFWEKRPLWCRIKPRGQKQ